MLGHLDHYPRTPVLGHLDHYPRTQVMGPLDHYPRVHVLGHLDHYSRSATKTLVTSSTNVAQKFGNFIHYPNTVPELV